MTIQHTTTLQNCLNRVTKTIPIFLNIRNDLQAYNVNQIQSYVKSRQNLFANICVTTLKLSQSKQCNLAMVTSKHTTAITNIHFEHGITQIN